MTYRYKLARRLAIGRRLARRIIAHRAFGMVPFVLLAAACAAGEPTATGDVPLSDAPIALAPRAVTLETNQASTFKAYAKAAKGETQVTAIEWVATGGNISADGKYSSNATGSYKVIGRRSNNAGTTADTAEVSIVPPQPSLTKVNVNPATASVPATGQQLFTVAGRLGDGSSVPIGVVWSATGGSIDAGGLYTTGSTPGNFQVVARNTTGSIADTVQVTVMAAFQQIVINPGTVSLQSGQTKQFSASARLSDGTTSSITNVQYSATGGTITSDGLFTAGQTPGTYSVTVTSLGGASSQATASVTISGGSGGPHLGGGGPRLGSPNEPAGMTNIAETDFSNVPENSEYLAWTSNGMLTGQRFQYMAGGASTTLSEGSASLRNMHSPPGIQRHLYPAGFVDGHTPGGGGVSYWQAGGSGNYGELYFAFWIRAAPAGAGGFQTHSTFQKLFYTAQAVTAFSNEAFLGIRPAGTTSQVQYSVKISQAHADGSFPGGAAIEFVPQTTVMVPINTFAFVEVHMKVNTYTGGTTNADGIFQMWVNGTMTHSYRNIRYISAAAPLGFYRVKWDPVFGGNDGEMIRNNQYLDLDHLYVSVK